MWYEYVIIFAGLGLAVAYVLWTMSKMFNAKGGTGIALWV